MSQIYDIFIYINNVFNEENMQLVAEVTLIAERQSFQWNHSFQENHLYQPLIFPAKNSITL